MDGRASLEPVLQSQVPELLQQLAPDWSDHLIDDDRPDRTKGGSVWIAKPSLTNGGAGVELPSALGRFASALDSPPPNRPPTFRLIGIGPRCDFDRAEIRPRCARGRAEVAPGRELTIAPRASERRGREHATL